MAKITYVHAIEVLDSRGNPTVEVSLSIDKYKERFIVPSGASTGKREALELRDKDNRYMGLGVRKAVNNVNNIIAPALVGKENLSQKDVDDLLNSLDNTPNKSKLGANAILGVSIAFLRASALYNKLPLYRYVGGGNSMPRLMMNIINGGVHAGNNLDIQEFMIVPINKDVKEAIRMGDEVFKNLGIILKKNNYSTLVGDEGGYAPNMKSTKEVLDTIVKAVESAKYRIGHDIFIALDVAASTFYKDGFYEFEGKMLSTDDMISYYIELCNKYSIISIEDPFDEDDYDGFKKLTSLIGDSVQIVGDDLFVTNVEYLDKGIKEGMCNAIIIKPNQVGTYSEMLETIKLAKSYGYGTIISHRSGDTEDNTISDIAVGLNLCQMKSGSLSRSERICKYNQLLRIDEDIRNTKSIY